MSVRPTHDQVLSLAPDRSASAAAVPLAVPAAWSAAGCDDDAVWGQYIATSAEPYNVAVDLSDDVGGPAYRCNCPSRKIPCKHTLGLLLLHASGAVAPSRRLPFAAEWLRRRQAKAAEQAPEESAAGTSVPSQDGGDVAAAEVGALGGGSRAPEAPHGSVDPARLKRQFERADRMRAGLQELDRWLADRIRVGLAAAELSDDATWERLAARLVDAQCGALANRVKRVAAKVGQHARWHEDVLEEMALLHALAVGAQRTGTLPVDLADGVHAATGLTVAKDDVLATVPSTARWIVAGESRTREDRITVQRTWLAADPGASSTKARPTWAMVLSFGAFGNEVTTEHQVGTVFEADLHWYPGGIPLRALLGRIHSEPVPNSKGPPMSTIAEALDAVGRAVAGEPWIERYPMSFRATPAPLGNARWTLADSTGAIAVVAGFSRMAEILSVSGGHEVQLMGEWSIDGFFPLTLHTHRQAIIL